GVSCPPQRFPKVLRHVKLNPLFHDNLLEPVESRCVAAVPVLRSLLSVAITGDATFIAAMIRTSCSVKPRVAIFHISATTENSRSSELLLTISATLTRTSRQYTTCEKTVMLETVQ